MNNTAIFTCHSVFFKFLKNITYHLDWTVFIVFFSLKLFNDPCRSFIHLLLSPFFYTLFLRVCSFLVVTINVITFINFIRLSTQSTFCTVVIYLSINAVSRRIWFWEYEVWNLKDHLRIWSHTRPIFFQTKDYKIYFESTYTLTFNLSNLFAYLKSIFRLECIWPFTL